MRSTTKNIKVILIINLLFAFVVSTAYAEIKVSYLYDLSTLTGRAPYNWAILSIDAEKNETYVIHPNERTVDIFDENGMQIYSFNDDRSLGLISDVSVDDRGNIFVLSYKGTQYTLTLSNFKGEQISDIKIKNIPKEFSEFRPERIKYLNKQLYLADLHYMKIAVTDPEGLFKTGFDIANIVGLDEKKRNESGMGGFSVDSEGNMLFTIPVLFSAYRLSPDGQLITFGTPGSAPGRFGIVGGIVADRNGNYYVADTLRCVIIIFDKDFRFQKEFGYFGVRPGNLLAPKDLALDNDSRVYVAQAGNRGVSVFRVTHN